jgi:cytochrome c2
MPPQPPAPRIASASSAVVNLTPAPSVPGDPNNGMKLFTQRGCVACHTVLRMENATGAIGPNLTNMSLRPTIAGEQIQNTPDNMARWIVNPPAMKPGTQMPVLGVSDQEARDLTAFLYSLPYNTER